MISILFLAADPTDMARLRLGEEVREIQEKLQLSKDRDNFALHQRFAVRSVDITQALLDVDPQIVHFSGHGTNTGALCVESRQGEMHPIQPEALAALFEQFAMQVKCVILNACYSEAQAQAISKHVEYVIGMSAAIGDRAAIAFAVGFYQAIGAGRSINEAYKLGCVQIRLENISEHLTPVIVKSKETEPQETEREDSFVQDMKSDDKKVMEALNSKYTWRTIRGIVLESLNSLSSKNLTVKSVEKGRWALTSEGRRRLGYILDTREPTTPKQ